MRVTRMAVALAFAFTVSLLAQPVLKPISFTLDIVDGTLAEVLDAIALTTGIEIQFDDSVSAEARNKKEIRVTFKNARLEDAIRFLTNQRGLSYEVVDETTVRIRTKQ